MTIDLDRSTAPLTSILSRRSLIGASALAVPAVLAVTTTPAFAVSADSLSIVVSPTTVAAGESAVVTVTVKSSTGVVAAGRAVSLASSASSVLSFSPTSGTTQSDGTFRSTVTASASASAQTVTITAVEGMVSASAALRVERYTVSAAVSPTAVPRSQSATVTATVTDSSGAAAAGRTVSWSTDAAGVSFPAPTGATDASGNYVTTVNTSASAPGGNATLTASNGVAAASTILDVQPVVINVPQGLQVRRGGKSILTVKVTDGGQRVWVNDEVTLSTTYPNLYLTKLASSATTQNITFTTSDTGTINASVNAAASAALGAATISATCLGNTVTFTVTVVA